MTDGKSLFFLLVLICVLGGAWLGSLKRCQALTAERDTAILQQQILEERAARVDAVTSQLRQTEERLRHETEDYTTHLATLRAENADLRKLLDTPIPVECLRRYPPSPRGVPTGP